MLCHRACDAWRGEQRKTVAMPDATLCKIKASFGGRSRDAEYVIHHYQRSEAAKKRGGSKTAREQ